MYFWQEHLVYCLLDATSTLERMRECYMNHELLMYIFFPALHPLLVSTRLYSACTVWYTLYHQYIACLGAHLFKVIPFFFVVVAATWRLCRAFNSRARPHYHPCVTVLWPLIVRLTWTRFTRMFINLFLFLRCKIIYPIISTISSLNTIGFIILLL